MKLRNFVIGLVAFALASPVFAQNRTRFSGIANAADFAYGVNGQVPALQILSGNSATGAQTITLAFGNVTLGDGTVLMPLATTAPITVGTGSNAETVTPSAVSCSTPAIYGSCTVTATFSNTHGLGDLVTSGTVGMAEAVNFMHSQGGGLVAFTAKWVALGGAVSQFSGKTYGWTNVTVLDYRGTSNSTTHAYSYYSGSATAPSNGGAYTVTANVLY